VRDDIAAVTLEDQVTALHEVAAKEPDLDLDRVAIRGWSFGGYLAAMAVLRRPDVFHAAVAGAPVTDWALYDTFYTERYLGLPDEAPEVYERTSLIPDAPPHDVLPLSGVTHMTPQPVVAENLLLLQLDWLRRALPRTGD
jgi:dipeptidyl-peptidase-4